LAQLVKLQLPVLIVPCGSGNDFARALNLHSVQDSLAAWAKFSSSRSNLRTIDLGVITPLITDADESPAPHYFCCIGGVGLDAEIARRANQLPRWLRAHGGYILSFLPALLKFLPMAMKISMPAAAHPDVFVAQNAKPIMVAAFANAPAYGGGMKIAPRAQLDDGILDVCASTT
jgi:diacylglycerol kinase (ATP)